MKKVEIEIKEREMTDREVLEEIHTMLKTMLKNVRTSHVSGNFYSNSNLFDDIKWENK